MNHYARYYEDLAVQADKDNKKYAEQQVEKLKAKGFSESEIKIILEAKKISNKHTLFG